MKAVYAFYAFLGGLAFARVFDEFEAWRIRERIKREPLPDLKECNACHGAILNGNPAAPYTRVKAAHDNR